LGTALGSAFYLINRKPIFIRALTNGFVQLIEENILIFIERLNTLIIACLAQFFCGIYELFSLIVWLITQKYIHV